MELLNHKLFTINDVKAFSWTNDSTPLQVVVGDGPVGLDSVDA